MANPNITFEPAGPEDTQTLIELDRTIFPEADIFEAEIYEMFDSFLIMDGERLIGSFGLLFNSGVWRDDQDTPPVCAGSTFLMTLGVLPDMRRQGIAKQAMAWMVEYARSKGQKMIRSTCRESNEESKALHRKLGFTILTTDPKFYAGPDEDAFVYALYLKK